MSEGSDTVHGPAATGVPPAVHLPAVHGADGPHTATARLLDPAALAGRRVWCTGDAHLAALSTVADPAGGYDVAVVAVAWTDLPDATKAVRAVVDGLAPDGVAVTSVAHPAGTLAGYTARDPLDAAYAGPPWLGALAAHAAEYAALGWRTRVVELVGVTVVVAMRLTE